MSIIIQNVSVWLLIFFFFPLFCWQHSLHLVSCIIRGFWAMLRWKTGKAARAKKLELLGFLVGVGESLWCCGVSWRQITHFDFSQVISAYKKKWGCKQAARIHKHTNICKYTPSKMRFELPPSRKICCYFGCRNLSYTKHSFWKFQFSREEQWANVWPVWFTEEDKLVLRWT